MVLQDPDTSGPKGSSYRGPTEILHKWSDRTLMQVVRNSKGSWYRFGSWYRDLAQVVPQGPGTSGPTGSPQGSWYRDPETEVLHKWSYKILIQVFWKDPHTEILRQRSCTSATTGSWYKWSKRILIQRSCYKCRADLPSLLVGVHSHTLFGVSCRDNFFLSLAFWV